MRDTNTLYKLDEILTEAVHGSAVSNVKEGGKTSKNIKSGRKIPATIITKELVERIIKRVERI